MTIEVFVNTPVLSELPSYEKAVNSSDVNDVVVTVNYFKNKYAIADGTTIIVNRLNQLLSEIKTGNRKVTPVFFTKNIESLNKSIKYCDKNMGELKVLAKMRSSIRKLSQEEITPLEANYDITQKNLEKMNNIIASLTTKLEKFKLEELSKKV